MNNTNKTHNEYEQEMKKIDEDIVKYANRLEHAIIFGLGMGVGVVAGYMVGIN